MSILVASVIGIFDFDNSYAQYMGNVGNGAFITTDRDSYTYTQNLDIVISGNIGNMQLPITLVVSCDAMPNPQSYITVFNNDVENYKAVDESGNFEHVIETLGFGCNKQTSSASVTIQGTNISTIFQMIGDEPAPTPAPTPTPTSVTVTTDDDEYETGDIIEISGGVTTLYSGTPISVIIKAPNDNLVWIQQVVVQSNKMFYTEFDTKEAASLMKVDGIYTVTSQYGTTSRSAETTFKFEVEQSPYIPPTPAPTPAPTPVPDEVFICHNDNIIKVNVNAIDAHLKHNDTIGQCSDQPAQKQPIPDTPLTVITALGSGVPGCENSTGCYIPNTMNVKVGDTVRFQNIDDAAHTFTSGSPDDGIGDEFNSNLVMAGTTFAFTFDDSGEYDYFCMVHPWMIGTIIVQEASSYVPTPQPTYKSTPVPKSTPKETDESTPKETGGYMGNVGSGGETGSYTLEEALEIQRKRIASAEANPPTVYLPQNDDSVKNLKILVKQNEKRIDVISKQLDSFSEKKVKSFDFKIKREQSQYDEYLKQYDYYEGKTLSVNDEQKFQKVVEKLNSQNKKIDSLIDERNMVVLDSDDVSKVVEEKAKPVPAVKQEEKPQKDMSCFLFWCW